MKKIIILMSILLILFLVITGCKDNSDDILETDATTSVTNKDDSDDDNRDESTEDTEPPATDDGISDGTTASPGTDTETPDSCDDTSDTGDGISDGSTASPDTNTETPDSDDDTSDTGDGISDGTTASPGTDTETPDSCDDTSDTGDGILDGSTEAPGTDTETPDSDDDTSDTGDESSGDVSDSVPSGNLEFRLINNDTEYEIAGIGDMTNKNIVIPGEYNGKPVTSIGYTAFSYCTNIESVVIPSTVTQIGGSAFYECTRLKSVTIPESVTSIGNSAFFRCFQLVEVYNLSSLTIEKGNQSNGYVGYYALDIYTSLSEKSKIDQTTYSKYSFYADESTVYLLGYTGNDIKVILPKDYKGSNYEIYKYAFYGDTRMMSIEIPSAVTNIGKWAFEGCLRLVEVYNLSSLNMYSDGGIDALNVYTPSNGRSTLEITEDGYVFCYDNYFNDCHLVAYIGTESELILPQTHKGSSYYINHYAFMGAAVSSVKIPASILSIGDSAFSGCSNLTTVAFEDNCQFEFIDNYAFSSCTSLKSITLPNGITKIGGRVFQNCENLESVSIPSSVVTIDFDAFMGCSKLTTVTFAKNAVLETIGNGAFSGCDDLTGIEVPSSVTTIGDSAFYNCGSLRTINIPANVSSLGSSAFANCESLTIVTFAVDNHLGFLDDDVFSYCTKLISVNIPSTVNSIGSGTFENCSSLINIQIPSAVESIGDNAFKQCSKLRCIRLPEKLSEIGRDAFRSCTSLLVIYNNSDLEIELKKDIATYATVLVDSDGSVAYSDEGSIEYKLTDEGLLFRQVGWVNDVTLIAYVGDEPVVSLPATVSGFYSSRYVISPAVFCGRTDIQEVRFDSSIQIESIPSEMFYGCVSLSKVEIPSSVTSIGSLAFSGCTSLTSINIPTSVTSIDESAFADCPNITIIMPSNEMRLFEYEIVEDSYVVIKKYIGESEDIVIPSSIEGHPVTLISRDCLSDMESYNVTLVGEVIRVDDDYVYLEHGDFTYHLVYSLQVAYKYKQIYFSGTPEDWARIEFEDVTYDEPYFYSEAQPSEDGNYWYYNSNGQVRIWNVSEAEYTAQMNQYFFSDMQLTEDDTFLPANLHSSLTSDSTFMTGVVIWEANHVVADPSYLINLDDGVLSKKDMYLLALYDVFTNADMQDSSKASISGTQETLILSVLGEFFSDITPDDVNVFEDLLKDISKDDLEIALNKASGSDMIEYIGLFADICDTSSELMSVYSQYYSLKNLESNYLVILDKISADTSNPYDLRLAAEQFKARIISACSMTPQEFYVQQSMIATGELLLGFMFDEIWDSVLDAMPALKIANIAAKGIQAIGEAFGIDEIVEAYYQMGVCVGVENAVRSILLDTKIDFLKYENRMLAGTYNYSVMVYKNIVLKGIDDSIAFMDAYIATASSNDEIEEAYGIIEVMEGNKEQKIDNYSWIENVISTVYAQYYE